MDIASGKVSSVEEALESVTQWMKRLGVSGENGEAFVNGKWYEIGDNFLRDFQNEAVAQMQLLQELVSALVFCISPHIFLWAYYLIVCLVYLHPMP